MKKIQIYRLGIQCVCLFLAIISFFTNFKFAMLGIMVSTFLCGTFFCGWICPFGFIQDLSSKLGKLLGIKRRKMPIKLQKYLLFSRYLVFIIVALIQVEFIFSIMSYDPRTNFEGLLLWHIPTIVGCIVIIAFLLIALFFDRPFCNYLCYEGAKNGLMSSLRLFTIKRDSSKCVNCKKCDKACPMNIEVSKCSSLRSPQCINCFQCVSSCPLENTLSYSPCNLKDKEERKKYLAITAIALLLAVGFMTYKLTLKTNPNTISTNIETSEKGSNQESETAGVITGEETEKLDDAPVVSDGTYAGQSEDADSIASQDPEATEVITGEEAEKSEDVPGVSDSTYTNQGEDSNSIARQEPETTEIITQKETEKLDDAPVVSDSTYTNQSEDSNTFASPEPQSTQVITGGEAEELGDAAGISDGTYTGQGEGFRGTMTIQVTVKDQTIVQVEVLEHVDDRKWFNRAYSSMPDKIIESQSADVDVVSGATYSSMGIIDGVKDALANAK